METPMGAFPLPPELSLRVLHFLPPPSIPRLALISRRFHNLVNDNALWMLLLTRNSPVPLCLPLKATTKSDAGDFEWASLFRGDSTFVDSASQLTRLRLSLYVNVPPLIPPDLPIPLSSLSPSLLVATRRATEMLSLLSIPDHPVSFMQPPLLPGNRQVSSRICSFFPENVLFKLLFAELGALTKMLAFASMDVVDSAVAASSEDNDSQTIAETMDDDSFAFWSSRGNPDPQSHEWLLYKLAQPICIISRIEIKPYKALYQRGLPTYAPVGIRIRTGFSPDPALMHFVSPIYPVRNTSDSQFLDVTPQLVFGGYVLLELLGRQQTQPGDEQFYTVLERVKVHGVPLGAFVSTLPILSEYLLNVCFTLDDQAWSQWPLLEPASSTAKRVEILQKNALPFLVPMNQKTDIIFRMKTYFCENKIGELLNFLANRDRAIRQEIVPAVLRHVQNRQDAAIIHSNALCRNIIREYIEIVTALNSPLTSYEILEFAKLFVEDKIRGDHNSRFVSLFWNLLLQDRIEASEELGDLLRPYEIRVALSIYTRANVGDKVR